MVTVASAKASGISQNVWAALPGLSVFMYSWPILRFFLLYSINLFKKYKYLFSFPSWWIKSNSSFCIFITISEDVDTLETSSVTDGQISVSLGSFVPFPNLTKNQSNSTCNCKSISIEIRFIFNFPISLSPKGHSISHASCWISNSGSECFRTIENPFG